MCVCVYFSEIFLFRCFVCLFCGFNVYALQYFMMTTMMMMMMSMIILKLFNFTLGD